MRAGSSGMSHLICRSMNSELRTDSSRSATQMHERGPPRAADLRAAEQSPAQDCVRLIVRGSHSTNREHSGSGKISGSGSRARILGFRPRFTSSGVRREGNFRSGSLSARAPMHSRVFGVSVTGKGGRN